MFLQVSNLSFSYRRGNQVLSNVCLEVREGETVSLVGPSGCGKSTLLHCIAGLLTPSCGAVMISGDDVTLKKPHERDVGIMMQDQPLYEHMTVEQNIIFPLKAMRKNGDVSNILSQLELNQIAKQKVTKCSGGERRRVAFGRAVVRNPKVLLLDEPFVSMQEELRMTIKKFIEQSGMATLLVTHLPSKDTTGRVLEMEEL